MKKTFDALNGAWEEPGVCGTRVEIDGDAITVLWQNAPVLETTFQITEHGGGLLLDLKRNGLRYVGAASDYAEVRQLYYRDGTLELTKFFPITGESTDRLTGTARSRYGDYEVRSDVLPELQGKWKSRDGIFELEIRRDEMRLTGQKTKICVLHSNDPNEPAGRFVIANKDPSVYDWRGFSRFIYENETLSALLIVYDAPSVEYVFEKE